MSHRGTRLTAILFGVFLPIAHIATSFKIRDGICPEGLQVYAKSLDFFDSGRCICGLKATKCWVLDLPSLCKDETVLLYGVKINGWHELLYSGHKDIPQMDLNAQLQKKLTNYGKNWTAGTITINRKLPDITTFDDYKNLYPGVKKPKPIVQVKHIGEHPTLKDTTINYWIIVYRFKLKEDSTRKHSFYFGVILAEPNTQQKLWELKELIPYDSVAIREHTDMVELKWESWNGEGTFVIQKSPNEIDIKPLNSQNNGSETVRILEYTKFDQGISNYEILLYESKGTQKLYRISRFKHEAKDVSDRISVPYEKYNVDQLYIDAIAMTSKIMMWKKFENNLENLHKHLKSSIGGITAEIARNLNLNKPLIPATIQLLYTGILGDYNYGIKTNTKHIILFKKELEANYFTALVEFIVPNSNKSDPVLKSVKVLKPYGSLLEILQTNKADFFPDNAERSSAEDKENLEEVAIASNLL